MAALAAGLYRLLGLGRMDPGGGAAAEVPMVLGYWLFDACWRPSELRSPALAELRRASPAICPGGLRGGGSALLAAAPAEERFCAPGSSPTCEADFSKAPRTDDSPRGAFDVNMRAGAQ